MYFIELLVKHFQRKKQLDINYNPLIDEQVDPGDECTEHIFMPIDSTGEVLACRNCGTVVNRKDLKDINFFRSK